jgi:uncharacterized repeat protein (TIGR01451 family)
MSLNFTRLTVTLVSLSLVLGLGYSLFGKFGENRNSPRVLGTFTSQSGYRPRFSTITTGAITYTGNALEIVNPSWASISGIGNNTGGTFISLNQNLQDDPYGPGTTSDWQQNSSAAQLRIPDGSEILHAELIWGGNQTYKNQDVSSQIDTSVKFGLPNNQVLNISPDPTTSAIGYYVPDKGQNDRFYVRSQNVTEIVKQTGAGRYWVGGVPAVMDRSNTNSNGAGWTLAVAYKNPKLPTRKLTIYTVLEMIESNTQGNLVAIDNFTTPRSGQMNGRLMLSALEGDSVLTGDQFTFGDAPNTLQPISGPNNPANNFFGSQINGDDGRIDRAGTLGDRNQDSRGINGTERHGWDITNVDISPYLRPNQTQAYAQATSQDDGYLVTSLAIQIDVYAPQMEISLEADRSSADYCLQDLITYTIRVRNNGQADSQENKIYAYVPNGTRFVEGSLKINNSPSLESITAGLNLGTIEAGRQQVITYQVKPIAPPTGSDYTNQASLVYSYKMLDNLDPISNQMSSNQVATTALGQETCIQQPTGPITKDDSVTTNFGTPITIDVTNNDSNIDPTTITIDRNPQHGTVEIKNSEIIYTPNPNFSGTDTLTYRVCDQFNVCTTAKVTITVKPKILLTTLADGQTLLPSAKLPGQVLGAYDNQGVNLVRTGGSFALWLSLFGLVFLILGVGATTLSHLDPEKPEKYDNC